MVELDDPEWLKGEDIEPESVLKFIDEGMHGEIPKEGDESNVRTFEIGVQLPDGSTRTWTMNRTSRKCVAGAYGKDTAKWIGRTVSVFVQDVVVNGAARKAIYARAPTPEMVAQEVTPGGAAVEQV